MNNNRTIIIKERYGLDCFSNWGRRGAENFWKKYMLLPVGINMFAIVNKQSGEIVNWLNGISPDNYA